MKEYKKGDLVQIEDVYTGKYFGKFEVVREMTKEEQSGIYSFSVKGYILKNLSEGIFKNDITHSNNFRMRAL